MMTSLQKAAMAWWFENGRPEIAHLHVVDAAHGNVETVTIEGGIIHSVGGLAETEDLSGILSGLFPDTNPLDENTLEQIQKRNLEAAANYASLPDKDKIEEIETRLVLWLERTVRYLTSDPTATVLLTGLWADYFPLEAALRRQFSDLDVFLDDPAIQGMLPREKTPRRSLVERGQQLYEDGTLKPHFLQEICLILLNEQGQEERIPLAKKGSVNPEPEVCFYAAKHSSVTLLYGEESKTVPLILSDETLIPVSATAEYETHELVRFREENGNVLATCVFEL